MEQNSTYWEPGFDTKHSQAQAGDSIIDESGEVCFAGGDSLDGGDVIIQSQ